MSEKAKAMIGALTGAASFVQSCKGGDAAIKDAVREWAVSKSELSQYVESLESRLAAAEAALAACEDTKRLDWLESHHACVGHHKTTDRWWSRAGRSFTSPRAAIDAARTCPKCNTAPLP